MRLRCPNKDCQSFQVYTLKDKTHVCRRCGHRWQEKGGKREKTN